MKKMRKGFTLIELLIVIIIIGVLSASMAIMSKSSTASAKAANIISNLKTMQSAASLYFFDHINSKDSDFTTANITAASPDYLGTAAKGFNGYHFFITNPIASKKKWYVYYSFNEVNDAETTEIKEKLAGHASKTGLLGSYTISDNSTYNDIFNGSINQINVMLQVR